MVPRLNVVPYCGSPPTPDMLASRWNLDPILAAALLIAALSYGAWASRTGRALPRWRRLCFFGGWALGALALTSPLCALSVSLFSARVGQHMLLILIAAPLVALGLPARTRVADRRLAFCAIAVTLCLWFWHAPGPYAATFLDPTVYWAMHVTMVGAAVVFWRAVLSAPAERLAPAAAATVGVGLQMALLGALITWSPRELFSPHRFTTAAFGLTPLQDQQFGGALMWAPAGLIFMAAVVVPLAWAMRSRAAPTPQLS